MLHNNLAHSAPLESGAVEFKQRDATCALSLNEVADIHEKMKQIVKCSNRLYVISLNAMFASRTATNGATGFVEVTALLRNFSQRLDVQVEDITSRINNLIYQSALIIKKQKFNVLFEQAVAQSEEMSIPESFILSNIQTHKEVEEVSVELSLQLSRCERLMQIGENLTVLAKVEAVASDDDGVSLAPITMDMTETINLIGECLVKSQQIIAAK